MSITKKTFSNKRMGDILIEQGSITHQQLKEALEIQKNGNNKRLGEIFVELGVITREELYEVLQYVYETEYVDLSTYVIDPEVISLIPEKTALRLKLLPISKNDDELNEVNSKEKNIITVEDPVEYKLNRINQIQVKPKINLTFANTLRSILRQDPDIIMIGEIRDAETAQIAVQAALTGHLVLSTLHTNDAASAVTRLVDMNIETFLISSSVIGVIAQRLVRVICENCKEEYEPGKDIISGFHINANSSDGNKVKLYRGAGCSLCKNTGYYGRTSIYELIVLDEEIRSLIISKASSNIIKDAAIKKGMKTLKEIGLQKVLQGITTIEEVLRVAG